MAKIHLYNIEGHRVCTKEFDKNRNIQLSFKDVAEMKKDIKSICKKCAIKIGKPYFDDDDIAEMYSQIS